MVANPSNYRPRSSAARDRRQPTTTIDLLSRMIHPDIQTVFMARGHDEAFCQLVTIDAALAIHAEIDTYDPAIEFRFWALKIAVSVGLEKHRTVMMVKERQPGMEYDREHQHHPILKALFAQSNKRWASRLLLRRRKAVELLLIGEAPERIQLALALDSTDHSQFFAEAVRKLKQLNRLVARAAITEPETSEALVTIHLNPKRQA